MSKPSPEERVAASELSGSHTDDDAKVPATALTNATGATPVQPVDDEEQALLASLQASRQEQDVYEDEVIRKATHQLAPVLTGVGLPALDSLVHASSSPSLSLPHLHAVLSNTRKKARELQQQQEKSGNESDLCHMKEQIILEYMQKVATVPKEDLPVRKNEARWLELRKRDEHQQHQKRQQEEQERRDSNKKPRVSFAVAVSSSVAPRRRQGRVSIMKRKQIDGPASVNLSNTLSKHKEEAVEPKERREELKKLRLERQRRKEARRKTWEEGESDVEDDDDDAESEQKQQPTPAADDPQGEHDHERQSKDTEAQPLTMDGDRATDADHEQRDDLVSGTASSALVCPLCQKQVEYLDKSTKDSALSAHMALCQEHERTSIRRSARLRGQNAGQNDENTGQEGALPVSKAKTRTTPRRKKTATALKPRVPPLDDLEEWVYEDRVDDWIENGIGRMREMKELDANDEETGAQDFGHGLIIPAWVNDRLFGYQREGLKVMWNWHKQEAGGILGDEMGLGKTVSISALLGSMASCRKLQSVLLIVPATMLNHWLTELSIWAPGLRRILIHPSGEVDGISRTLTTKLLNTLDKWVRKSRSNRVYECIDEEDRAALPAHSFCGTGYAIVTTYENVRRNPNVYMSHDFSYVVLDEAQKIKAADSDITVACKRIRTPHRIAMSGTPIMNDLKELWSLFDFVFPGRLGTQPAFEQEFGDPIRKGGYSNATPMQVQLAYRCALVLKDLIEPYLLRRLKKDVKEVSRMPSKTEHVLFCRLSPNQRALYEAYLRSDDVAKVVRGTSNLLGAITMLRKICNHPDLVCEPSEGAIDRLIKNGFARSEGILSDDEEEEDDLEAEETLMERSGKLEVLSKILPLWKKQGHRVLIFCQWRKMLNIVQRFMMMRGWKFGRLDGNTNVAARQRLVDEFNKDESYFAMLCTTRTGGVGLNLTGASRVCLYSPDWNPQIDAQARERAWRFGQKKDVTVYRLITAGTVEEKIYHRQIFKTALSNRVLQDPRQKRLFSQRDLRDLFTLKQDTGSINSGADGVTETGEMTKGEGVVDVDESENEEKNLKDVMQSKGLAGIFDHNFVEGGGASAKTASAREMEEQAKKVAQEAVEALRHSVEVERRSATFQSQRFGVGAGGGSSRGLLDSLQQRAASTKRAGNENEPIENLPQYTQLLRRIKEYVRIRKPSTGAILKEFSNVPASDAAIFRRLLKSVANLQDGRWLLNN